jgi:hypothetical protein
MPGLSQLSAGQDSSQQQKFLRVHVAPGLQSEKVNSARKIAAIELDLLVAVHLESPTANIQRPYFIVSSFSFRE